MNPPRLHSEYGEFAAGLDHLFDDWSRAVAAAEYYFYDHPESAGLWRRAAELWIKYERAKNVADAALAAATEGRRCYWCGGRGHQIVGLSARGDRTETVECRPCLGVGWVYESHQEEEADHSITGNDVFNDPWLSR